MGGRRNTLCAVFLLVASLMVAGARDPEASAQVAPEKPNILLIVTDDQRDGLKVMPHTRTLIRRRGVMFKQAYATTPLCCPSRSSIFTGQYTHNHNVRRNRQTGNLDHDTTIQRYLSEAGYATGFFGKFLNRWRIETPPPYFDHFAMLRTGGKLPRYYDAQWNVNGDIRVLDGYSTDILGKQAVGFLNELENPNEDHRPWYVYLAPNAPHSPFEPSKKYRDAKVPPWDGNPAVFEEDKSDKPPYIAAAHRTFKRGKRIRAKQFRMLMSVDDLVNEVLLRLDELGETENTLVIYMSDNGFLWTEHGLVGKNVPYRVASRIPFLMKWPGRVGSGGTDTRLTANIDVAPTLADAAEIEDEILHTMDGRSLLDTSWDRDRLLLESYVPDWASMLTDNFQYNEYYDESGQPPATREYYDLLADPWQLENLLGDDDPLNDPLEFLLLKLQLSKDRSCAGETCP